MRTQGESLRRGVQRALAIAAAVFGLATLVAGGRVLLGNDPGYEVYRPLLAYNTMMGTAYVAAAILAWMKLRWGMVAAGAILLLNALVLGLVLWVRSSTGEVAAQSVAAMTLRTVLWLLLWASFWWLARREQAGGGPRFRS